MKCAIYTRVSKDCIEQKSSIQNQKDLFIKYVSEQGWDIYDFYIDIQSGSKPSGRKNLERMIKDAKDKKFDIILAKELSRLARNGKVSYTIKEIATENNIHLITLDGAINTIKGDIDKFGLFAWLYENEAQTISNRIKHSLNTKASRGEFKGGTPPYGYHLENSKLVVNNDETPLIVKRIFKEYLSGIGYDAIAKNLFSDRIVTPSQYINKRNASNIWHGATVRKILTNENYTGDLVQSKTSTKCVTTYDRKIHDRKDQIIIKNCHEPIISREIFDAVQRLINSRKRIKPKPHKHLFSNLLFCADCGKGMHFKQNRRGYVCGSYDKRGNIACSDHIVREKDLENTVKDQLLFVTNIIKNKDYKSKMASKLSKQTKIEKRQLTKYKSELENYLTKKKEVLNLLLHNTITEIDYKEYIHSFNNDIKQLNTKIYTLENKLSNNVTIGDINLKELEEFISETTTLTPNILNRFIEKIEILKDGSPKIFFRFKDPRKDYPDIIK